MTTEDQITGLHRRFDKLEANFDAVQTEQHEISRKVDRVDHRVDLMELQIDASQKRENMIVESINEKLAANTQLIKKLFDRFDGHTEAENADRKKLLFWLISTAVSVLGTVAWTIFNKVFGA